MLEFLRTGGKLSERKARLFAAACCRRIGHFLDEGQRKAVEQAEWYAERATGRWYPAGGVVGRVSPDAASAASAAVYAAYPDGDPGVVATYAAAALASADADFDAERGAQAALLRDIFGSPFRPPRVAPSVLSWNDGTIVKLASAVYEERDFTQGRMGVIADAMEEAGCTDQQVLSHLREQGVHHVRGCFVVDLLLGRE
jgi:hypothetical protein